MKNFTARKLSRKFLLNVTSCSYSRMFHSKQPFLTPHIFRFVATWFCNCNCLICGIPNLKKPQKEIPLPDLKTMLHNSRPALADVRRISVAGGEPFLRKDLVEALLLLAKHCPKVSEIGIATNGSLPEKTFADLKRLVAAIPSTKIVLTVSLDGIGSLHDEIRGYRSLFERALLTIEKVKVLRTHHQNLDLTCQITYNTANIPVRKQIEDFVTEMGIPFCYDFAHLADSLYWNGDKAEHLLQPEAVRDIFHRRNFIDYYILKQHICQRRYLPCPAPFNLFSLAPDGGIANCIMCKEAGNLYHDSLMNILRLEKIEKTFAQIKESDLCRACYFRCGLKWELYGNLPQLLRMGITQILLMLRN